MARLGQIKSSIHIGHFLFIAYMVVSALILYVSPESAASLRLLDPVEYAVSAYRLATQGSFDLVFGETVQPTRYQPGFGVFFLTPVYLISSSNIGLGILPVFFSALMVFVVLWKFCRQILTENASLVAAFILLAATLKISAFYNHTRGVMSDMPVLMIGCFALVAFQSAWYRPNPIIFLTGGLLSAVAVSVRLTSLSICLPFIFLLVLSCRNTPPREWVSWALALFTPIAASLSALLTYNYTVFGSPFLTGYHYWFGKDFSPLTARFIWENAGKIITPFSEVLIGPLVLTGIVIMGILCRKHRQDIWKKSRPLLIFFIFGTFPIVLFHLFFIYPSAARRYVLLFHTLALLIGAIWSGAFMERIPRSAVLACAIFSVALSLWIHPPNFIDRQYDRVLVTRAADQYLPQDAVIISTLHGFYIHQMVIEGTQRKFIPFDRHMWGMKRWKYDEAFEYNAFDSPERIGALIKRGRRVFLLIHEKGKFQKEQKADINIFIAGFEMREMWTRKRVGTLMELLKVKNYDPEQRYKNILANRENNLGLAHPKVTAALKDLADFYRTKQADEKMVVLYQRALSIRESALSPDHPQLAAVMMQLASIYRGQKAYNKALPLYQRVLSIWEKSLGSDHPQMAGLLRQLAGLYIRMGKTEEEKKSK